MDTKKVFIGISIVIIVLLGILMYQVFTPNTTPITQTPTDNFPVARPISEGGMGEATTTTRTNTTPVDQTDTTTVNRKILFQISKDPISGYIIPVNSSSTMVRYTDRMTGHTYETALNRINLIKSTITTVPQVYESVWSNNGSYVALRYLSGNDLIKTFWGKVGNNMVGTTTTAGENNKLLGFYLPNNTMQFTTSPAGDKIFFLTSTNEGSVGFTAKNDLTARTEIFSSPAREWLVTWPTNDVLIFNTKPSYAVPGYVFSLNIKTGIFDKLFGEINGLTTTFNNDASKLLYSESLDKSLQTIAFSKKGKVTLSLKTLPEKCVWSSLNNNIIYCAVPQTLPAVDYPDAWYQGQISFNDDIWSIDATTGETRLISNLFDVRSYGIDAINLQLDKDENYLTFMNKKDMQLWGLKLR